MGARNSLPTMHINKDQGEAISRYNKTLYIGHYFLHNWVNVQNLL